MTSRNAGNETEKQSADDHDDRIWRSKSLGEKSENDDKKEQKKQDQFELFNAAHGIQPIAF